MSKWKILKFLQASQALGSCHLFLYTKKMRKDHLSGPH